MIVGIDDTEITDVASYREAMAARNPGEVVELAILRDGRPLTLTATLDP